MSMVRFYQNPSTYVLSMAPLLHASGAAQPQIFPSRPFAESGGGCPAEPRLQHGLGSRPCVKAELQLAACGLWGAARPPFCKDRCRSGTTRSYPMGLPRFSQSASMACPLRSVLYQP